MRTLNLIIAASALLFASQARANEVLWSCEPLNSNVSDVKSLSIGYVEKSMILSAKVSTASATKEFFVDASETTLGGTFVATEEDKNSVIFSGEGFALNIEIGARPLKGGKPALLNVDVDVDGRMESVDMVCAREI